MWGISRRWKSSKRDWAVSRKRSGRIYAAIRIGEETKFRLGINTKLLSGINQIVVRRGISVSAFATEAFEPVVGEEAGDGNCRAACS